MTDAPWAGATQQDVTPGLADDVRAGLGRQPEKWLLSKYLYDALGSVLFEAITYLPEYGLTDADIRILRDNAEAIAGAADFPEIVAELGSGSGRKVRWLLDALARRHETTYCPIDISAQAIAQCEAEIGRIDGVTLKGIVDEYLSGLRDASRRRPEGTHLLVLFVGSSIGNFDRPEALRLLREIHDVLQKGDRFLLGTDLVKSESQLIPAYDDPLGVTAAFNLNLLARLNRELGADFDLSRFDHQVRWNSEERRMEMHLRSVVAQAVRVPAADLVVTFEEGETIWTESSYKFLPEEPAALGRAAGFELVAQWVDRQWPFAETMLGV